MVMTRRLTVLPGPEAWLGRAGSAGRVPTRLMGDQMRVWSYMAALGSCNTELTERTVGCRQPGRRHGLSLVEESQEDCS